MSVNKENNPTSRRRFLRLSAYTGAALLADFLLPGCINQNGPQPETDAEHRIAKTTDLFRNALQHANVDQVSAASLAQAGLCNKGNMDPVYAKFDAVIKPYKRGLPADFSIGAVMSAAPFVGEINCGPNKIDNTYENIKANIISDEYAAGSLTALAINNPEHLGKINYLVDATKKIDGQIYDPDNLSILTSLALKSDLDTVKEYYKDFSSRNFYYNRTKAILTIPRIVSGAGKKDVLDAYDESENFNSGFFATEGQNATLATALIINQGRTAEIKQMYNFAKKVNGVDPNQAARMTLATVSHENSLKIISTESLRAEKGIYFRNIVPVVLG